MELTSFAFGIFFTIVFFLYWWKPKHRTGIVLTANLVFYSFAGIQYGLALLAVILLSFYGAIILERREKKRLILIVTLILISSGLLIYKYLGLFLRAVGAVFSFFAQDWGGVSLNLIAPLGISYYTFQAISYVVDVYRGKTGAEKSLVAYGTCLSFFLTVSSGPIERISDLLPRMLEEKRFNYDNAVLGMERVLWGCFKKLVIADNLGVFVNAIGEDIFTYSGFVILLAGFGFTMQLYCDFSGYSDMVTGFAKMLNIQIKDNFKSPYFSASVREFWSRWHISLSTWLRDYVYIPLGGSRCTKVRAAFNLLCTFLISGIWHGAGVKFLIWGAMHGVLQCLENLLPKKFSQININSPAASVGKKGMIGIKIVFTFILINFTWLPFWLPTTRSFLHAVRYMFKGIGDFGIYITEGINHLGMGEYMWTILGLAFFILFLHDYRAIRQEVYEGIIVRNKKWHSFVRAGILVFILCCNCVAGKGFIYFQF